MPEPTGYLTMSLVITVVPGPGPGLFLLPGERTRSGRRAGIATRGRDRLCGGHGSTDSRKERA